MALEDARDITHSYLAAVLLLYADHFLRNPLNVVNPCCGQQVVSFDGFGLEPVVCFPYRVGGYAAAVFDIYCLNNRSVFGIRDLNVSNGSKARTGHGRGFHLPLRFMRL